MEDKHEQIIKAQKELCKRVGKKFVPSAYDMKIGISKNVFEGVAPINGIRHNIEGDTTGWYIFAGEDPIPQEDADFFEPLCVKHLIESCPQVLKYLGLPPGTRFQIDHDGYEDIWDDPMLLVE